MIASLQQTVRYRFNSNMQLYHNKMKRPCRQQPSTNQLVDSTPQRCEFKCVRE